MNFRLLSLPLIALAFAGCTSEPAPSQGYRVVNSFPHDTLAYCQGLIFLDGKFVESTGQYGHSSIRRVIPESGVVEQKRSLKANIFGEGLTIHDGELWQLTWKAGLAYVLDPETLAVKREVKYQGDGWGITSDGKHLITSNGTNQLTFRDPKTFEKVRTISVTDGEDVYDFLNELEYINGEIWANVWKREYIVRINPKNGALIGWIDMRGLYDPNLNPHPDSVLNGIAWDKENDRIFVTGKLWPTMFEIEVVDKPKAQG